MPSVTLQDQLDRITQMTRTLVQAERLAVSEAATEELFRSDIEERILPVGRSAPDFVLADAVTGKPVRLADVLALGPVVLNYFADAGALTALRSWSSGGIYTDSFGGEGSFCLRSLRRPNGRTTLPCNSIFFPSRSCQTPGPRWPDDMV